METILTAGSEEHSLVNWTMSVTNTVISSDLKAQEACSLILFNTDIGIMDKSRLCAINCCEWSSFICRMKSEHSLITSVIYLLLKDTVIVIVLQSALLHKVMSVNW